MDLMKNVHIFPAPGTISRLSRSGALYIYNYYLGWYGVKKHVDAEVRAWIHTKAIECGWNSTIEISGSL